MNYYEEFIATVRGDLSEQIEEVSRSFAERVLPGLIELCREAVKAAQISLEEANQRIKIAIAERGIAELVGDCIASLTSAIRLATERTDSRSWTRAPHEIRPRGLRTVDKRSDIRRFLRCMKISRQ